MKVSLKRTMVRKNQTQAAAAVWLGRAGRPSGMAADLVAHMLKNGIGEYTFEGRTVTGPHGYSLHMDDLSIALYGKPEQVFEVEVEEAPAVVEPEPEPTAIFEPEEEVEPEEEPEEAEEEEVETLVKPKRRSTRKKKD